MNKLNRSICPIACTLDIIGDRWTVLVVRDLFLGRKYFKDFLSSPEAISTNILTDRLKRLTDAAIIETSPDPATAGRCIYMLTDKGRTLLPLLEFIKEWGLNHIKGTSIHLQAHT
jgi:DNA-binding HxlR family transcriptional regulator